jgi:hypothetical protein
MGNPEYLKRLRKYWCLKTFNVYLSTLSTIIVDQKSSSGIITQKNASNLHILVAKHHQSCNSNTLAISKFQFHPVYSSSTPDLPAQNVLRVLNMAESII